MRRHKKRIRLVIVLLVLLIIIALGLFGYYYIQQKEIKAKEQEKENALLAHYNNYVITNKEASLYNYENDKLVVIGKVQNGENLTLEKAKVTSNYEYFKIANDNLPYYIYYEDVDKINSLMKIDNRYQKYIPFNENIVTKDVTNFYDKDDNLIYQINDSFDLPIIIKEKGKYGIEFNGRLLYVKKDNVTETKENKNTDKSNTNHIGVLNYHFFWDDDTEKQSDCNQSICLSKTSFKKQLDMINELELLTITMEELEMYIDGKLRLPKSVVITIDDGWKAKLGIEILNEYKMHGTLFLITGSYNPEYYTSEYVELHSHTNKMHGGGQCPGGQGGGIKCLPRDTILSDLKASREKLNGTTVFCYPFYEYNNYAIGLLKEAGFTMAFAGENGQDNNYVKVGSQKYTLPRFVVGNYTTMNDLRIYLAS